MQRRNVDTSSLRDFLYGHLNNRAQAAFNYIPVPPALPNAAPAQPAAPAQQAAQPVATRVSIVRELTELTNLRNLYMNSPGMEELVPPIMHTITTLQNQLNAMNQAK